MYVCSVFSVRDEDAILTGLFGRILHLARWMNWSLSGVF